MDVTIILQAIIALASAFLTAYIVPLLKSKLNADDIAMLETLARVGVYAAEQLFSTEQAIEKKLYVQKYLSDKGYKVDTAEVNNAIEAAVLALHRELEAQG